ncbi:hypothetical protein [Desulfobulbus alkaliphilus]|uniref:hypothetical protein n=1 Tax=Desulfobulbus alkaliphilus TaxID=869814 RepID=UPI0019626ADC|nr:hypothetical protein [Desulfobulbus alkaliphilus]MBM9536447.1 hypothetical protein [Desulfobulbus alkaliphilus]
MFWTSISPQGRFRIGVHTPTYQVSNLRRKDYICALGLQEDDVIVDNHGNVPPGDVNVDNARPIYEICNPLPFRGCTFIDSGWADDRASDPGSIALTQRPQLSLRKLLNDHCAPESVRELLLHMPLPLRYELAATSTDPEELIWLAESCCSMVFAAHGQPVGLRYEQQNGRRRPIIHDFELFETIANNPYLPDVYKEVMVLRPGVQGSSEIVGDYQADQTEIFEYLRSNSYIPWGHYAANFAHTCIRYRIAELSLADMEGLRHLYYQRMYVTLAEQLGLQPDVRRRSLTKAELEHLRLQIIGVSTAQDSRQVALATLWGWNFGYDFSGTGYRLHASHQMIHQQYATVPPWVADADGGPDRFPAFSSGDQVADVIERYRREYQSDFFADYLRALFANTRIDNTSGESSLVVWQDRNVLLFVPKAQVSQWEVQLMVLADGETGPVGNVFEADEAVRSSIDAGILKAQQVLAGLGATLVTSIEYSKRLGMNNGQRLLYAFLPKLPWSMGAFSEAQGRYILGHYPEDFAIACRRQLQ